MTTVKTILEGFTFLSITRQPGLLTYSVINDAHQMFKSNATFIQSKLGGGDHGLLGLVLQAATYQTLTSVAFAAPVNPSPFSTIPVVATGPQISALKCGHKCALPI